jgi:predicted RNA-binding Zn-ribbon protein involved in translation (DUF1610 family)
MTKTAIRQPMVQLSCPYCSTNLVLVKPKQRGSWWRRLRSRKQSWHYHCPTCKGKHPSPSL